LIVQLAKPGLYSGCARKDRQVVRPKGRPSVCDRPEQTQDDLGREDSQKHHQRIDGGIAGGLRLRRVDRSGEGKGRRSRLPSFSTDSLPPKLSFIINGLKGSLWVNAQ
jgi:hypothetical protein